MRRLIAVVGLLLLCLPAWADSVVDWAGVGLVAPIKMQMSDGVRGCGLRVMMIDSQHHDWYEGSVNIFDDGRMLLKFVAYELPGRKQRRVRGAYFEFGTTRSPQTHPMRSEDGLGQLYASDNWDTLGALVQALKYNHDASPGTLNVRLALDTRGDGMYNSIYGPIFWENPENPTAPQAFKSCIAELTTK